MLHGGPAAADGMRIGLLGGSFDPPHEGHALITRQALTRLRLDRVWWLVTPGNPKKDWAPADIATRIAACRALMRHPRVVVTDVEIRLGTRYTADTLAQLRRRRPGVRFVWLMGADNLSTLHHWDHWERIMETTPMAVFQRPGAQLRAGLSRAAQRYRRARAPQAAAAVLALRRAPAWTLLTGPTSGASSTALRARGAWADAGDG